MGCTCRAGRQSGLVRVAAFDGEITAGVHDGFVSVIKADEVGRRPALAPHLQDHPVPVCGPNGPSMDDDAVALRCLHGNHLPAQEYDCLPGGERAKEKVRREMECMAARWGKSRAMAGF